MSSTVVATCDCSESFLPGCVPLLNMQQLSGVASIRPNRALQSLLCATHLKIELKLRWEIEESVNSMVSKHCEQVICYIAQFFFLHKCYMRKWWTYNLQLYGLPIHLYSANFLPKQNKGKRMVSRSTSQNARKAAPEPPWINQGDSKRSPSPLTKSTPMVLM